MASKKPSSAKSSNGKSSKGKSAKTAKAEVKKKWYRSATLYKVLSVMLLALIIWSVYLDAQVRYRFEGKRWSLPAQVYARALELYEGRALNLNNFKSELSLLGYQQRARASSPGTYHASGSSVTLNIREHHLPDGSQPSRRIQFSLNGDVISNLKSADSFASEKIYTLEPVRIGGIYPASKEERKLLAYHEMPAQLIRALLITEDQDFFVHWGVSPLSIARAMWVNFRAGQVVQGGSTLTQQLVKNFYLSRERSIVRKFNEALMALMLETHYTKAEILETYANDIFLGQAGGTAIHGFAMASEFYFGKPLAHADLSQYALLVALVKGPSYYDPRRYPERAKKRRNLVLKLLFDAEAIDQNTYDYARKRGLGIVKKPKIASNRYPAFMDLVKRQLKSDYNEEDLRSNGLKIYTTMDPQVQSQLESASKKVLPLLDTNSEATLQLGAIFTDAGTGEILGMLGDRDPRKAGFNRALDASRQIGSLIKPAVYMTALQDPSKYHLASQLKDEQFKLEFENGDVWQPRNFNGKANGDILMYEAWSRSLNMATARLGLETEVPEVHKILKKMGVSKALNPYPSLLLGAQNMTPFEVAHMYQTIASNGFRIPLRSIKSVQTEGGDLLKRYPIEFEEALPPQLTHLAQFAMQQTMREGTGKSAYRYIPSALAVAGKTGTTNEGRDSWFSGFSGDYVGTVWLGYDDNLPSPLTGSSGALRVWSEVMAKLPQYPLENNKPSQITYRWINEKGVETDESCKGAQPLPFWGQPTGLSFEACTKGYSSLRAWFKSWF